MSLEKDIAFKINACGICGINDNLLRCGQCKATYYCSKEHQRQDWKKHKLVCKKSLCCDSVEKKYGHIIDGQRSGTIPKEGSSEDEILSSLGVHLSPTNNNYQKLQSDVKKCSKSDSPNTHSEESITHSKHDSVKYFTEISLQSSCHFQDDYLEEMCHNVIQDLTDYGLCVLDNFLGAQIGKKVLKEVLQIEKLGLFKDGQLVSTKGKNKEELKTIRSDQICWVHGKEKEFPNIGYLVTQVDSVIMKANKMPNNGKLGNFNVNGRTKVSYIVLRYLYFSNLFLHSEYFNNTHCSLLFISGVS